MCTYCIYLVNAMATIDHLCEIKMITIQRQLTGIKAAGHWKRHMLINLLKVLKFIKGGFNYLGVKLGLYI